jgi:hypothetical protein
MLSSAIRCIARLTRFIYLVIKTLASRFFVNLAGRFGTKKHRIMIQMTTAPPAGRRGRRRMMDVEFQSYVDSIRKRTLFGVAIRQHERIPRS